MHSQLGRYEIASELGRGGMGTVYKAKDPEIGRFVALKVIDLQKIGVAEREEFAARFRQEAMAAGRLNHPNIVTIHDVGKKDNVAYIAMELVEGRVLSDLLTDRRLSIDALLDMAIQMATALAHAGHSGIVHRDIKPENIMVLADGRVKIVDFGIARMDAALAITSDGKGAAGSPLYMSPEQVLNHPVDSRSDIFSLGVVLHQMLTGRLPFYGDNVNSVMYQIVNEDPPLPSSLRTSVPDILDPIVSRCLAKDLGARYQSADELADDLRDCRARLQQAKDGVERLRNFLNKSSPRIYQLVYVSHPTKALNMAGLVGIMTKAQYKNLRLDISGLLIFHNGKFMQLLEGSESAVKDLFATIRQDPRHMDVDVLLEIKSTSRCMPSWVMAFSPDERRSSGEMGDQDFYISPETTVQICESMDGEIGRKFLEFLRT